MDRSYPYTRRVVSRARQRKRVAALTATALAGAAALFVVSWEPDPISAAVAPRVSVLAPPGDSRPDEAPAPAMRRIYPYSVVPGGVSGADELARAIRADRVVAAHYASFDVGQARPVVVRQPRAVHVSYRKGGQVYWTARKVMLAEGETLLTDGRSEVRARCANRISDVPQYPVEAHHPIMAELDDVSEVNAEFEFDPAGTPPSTGNQSGGGRRMTPFIPKPPPFPPPPRTTRERPPPPVDVPEPGSIWLFGLALAGMLVMRRRRRT